MSASLTFLGAARTVTGSCHLLSVDGRRILIDCGLFQERELQARNWERLAVPPSSLDAIVLTHGHLDHCGLLPRLCAQGFKGRVHCTRATAGIAPLVMADSAHLQEEDARFKEKRHAAEGRRRNGGYLPLYGSEDAAVAAQRLAPAPWRTPVAIAPGLTAAFHPAGHILGAAMVRIQAGSGTAVLFSGDLGSGGNPLVEGPVTDAGAPNLVVESTYGDREHEVADVDAQLASVLATAWQRGGNVVVPCFAIERAQEILFRLRLLHDAGKLAGWRIFLDSPMAINVLEVFRQNPEACAPVVRRMLAEGRSPFDLPGLTLCTDRESSKAINDLRQGAMVLAGAGMCNGGRVKHHLEHNLERPESSVLFVGYQASGTLGRQILDSRGRAPGMPPAEVRLFGRQRQVRCAVEQVRGFSGHAGRSQILDWARQLQPSPRRAFVVHGGENVTQAFAAELAARTGWSTVAPQWGEEIALT
jgi:metallo-beta-lactamase family protein